MIFDEKKMTQKRGIDRAYHAQSSCHFPLFLKLIWLSFPYFSPAAPKYVKSAQ